MNTQRSTFNVQHSTSTLKTGVPDSHSTRKCDGHRNYQCLTFILGIFEMYGLFLEAKHYLRYVVAGVSFVGHLDHKFTLMAAPEPNEQRRGDLQAK